MDGLCVTLFEVQMLASVNEEFRQNTRLKIKALWDGDGTIDEADIVATIRILQISNSASGC